MPTISAGSSATISVERDGGVAMWSGSGASGTFTDTPGSGPARVIPFGPGATAVKSRPMPDGGSVTIAVSSGSVTYAETPSSDAPIEATWNNAGTTFTALKVDVTDTASAAGSLLADFRIGGASKASMSKAGALSVSLGTKSAPSINLAPTTGIYSRVAGYVMISASGQESAYFGGPDATLSLRQALGFTGSELDVAPADTFVIRDAANALAQRNGAAAQKFAVYNTYTDASNYERGVFDWQSTANQFRIRTEASGTGVLRSVVLIGGSGKSFAIGDVVADWNIDATTSSLFPFNAAWATLGKPGKGLLGIYIDYTNVAPGTTGAQTINKAAGRVNFAASATSLVVTNSLCTAATKVFATVASNDGTAYIKNVVPAAGSFTITLGAAATAETAVDFFLVNAD